MSRARVVVVAAAILIAGFLALDRAATLPPLANRTVSTALTETESTRIGRLVAPLVAAHAPLSGIYGLPDALDAFAARIRIAQAAERSLDVQYYIWHDDLSGTMMFDALRAAADRGVRVRLLLDDNNTDGLDDKLAALDSHPNIEVRLFNPFVIRRLRRISYLTDFSRLNRRMHNKSFTADNQVTIIGGRNIGDEYFGAAEGVLFADFDVMAVGPVVGQVSSQFDRYWASGSAYPIDVVLPSRSEESGRGRDGSPLPGPSLRLGMTGYVAALQRTSFVQKLEQRSLQLEWAPASMISDDPAKALGNVPSGELVIDKMKAIFGEPRKTLDLVSPYFVPGENGTALLSGWASHGVRVRVLTNAAEATDVAAVHAGYAKRRKALLAGGVRLFELRRAAQGPRTSGSGSGSSLHAKTFAVDGSRIFVGSFNFDPRSARLNTEMGFVIDSPEFAAAIQRTFDEKVPFEAYEVRRADDGRLEWVARQRGAGEGTRAPLSVEPGTSWWLRTWISVMSHLPIEWLL